MATMNGSTFTNIIKQGDGDESVSATSLSYSAVSQMGDLGSSNSHFAGIPLKKTNVYKQFMELLASNMRERQKKLLQEVRFYKLEEAISLCMAGVFGTANILRKGIENEATLRFTIADPLVKMVCHLYNYEVKLEESVTADDSIQIQVKTSSKSRADYICYRIEDDEKCTVAVVLEAKCESRCNDNIIAQTLGYYGRTEIDEKKPGIAIMLTDTRARFFFFPFAGKKGYGINSIILLSPSLEFKIENQSLRSLLGFITVIAHVRAEPITCLAPKGVNIYPIRSLKGVLTLEEKHKKVLEEN